MNRESKKQQQNTITTSQNIVDEHALIGGGFLFSHCIENGVCHITIVHETNGYDYDDSTWFKYSDYEVGLRLFKKLCSMYGSYEFKLHCISDYKLNKKDKNLYYYDKGNSRRDSKRRNKKEEKYKQYKINKNKIKNKNIEPHSRDVSEISPLYIPIIHRYMWRSQRPQMDDLYENFTDMLASVYPAMMVNDPDYRAAFDTMDVWLSRVSRHFYHNPYSLLPGPPLEEQLLCEIIVICNDVNDMNLPFTIIGWMVYNYHLRNNVLGYFVYWYQHYKSYVSNDQILSIAFPRNETEPHGRKFKKYKEPTEEQMRQQDYEASLWLAENLISDSEDEDKSNFTFGFPQSIVDRELKSWDEVEFCPSVDSEKKASIVNDRIDDLLGTSDVISEIKIAASEIPGATDGEVDKWLGHAESLVILGRQLYKSQDFEDCLLAAIAYVKIHCKGQSAILQLREVASWSELQSDFIEPHGYGQDIVDGWNLCRQNKNFKRVSYLISAALSMSICSIKELNWTFAGFEILSIQAAKEQLDAVDLIDSIVKTFSWIARSGANVFLRGDIRSILYDDPRMTKFLEICDEVLAYSDTACAGNLQTDMNDFRSKLDYAIDTVVELKKAQNGGPSSLWLQKKYSDLIGVRERIIAKDRTTAIRFAPIGFSISGPTGVGKSTLSALTMKTSLQSMGFVSTSDRIITLDPADKYQSTYTSDINGMYIDDFANTKSKFEETAPTSYVIKFFNNVAAQAIKAEIQAKGVVFINFKCGVITTNSKELDVRQYSNCPESILRRFYHVTVSVLPQYRKDGSQLDNFHPDLQGASITNVWALNIEEVITTPEVKGMLGRKATNDGGYDFRIVEIPNFEGQAKFRCENMDLTTYLKVVVYLSERHKKSQFNVVKRANDLDKMKYCKETSLPLELCQHCVIPAAYEMLADLFVSTTSDVLCSYWKRWLAPARALNWLLGWSSIKEWQTRELELELHKMMDSFIVPTIIACVPESVFRIKIVQSCLRKWQYGAAFLSVPRMIRSLSLLYLFFLFVSVCLRMGSATIVISSFIMFIFSLFLCLLGWQARYREVEQEFCRRRDALPEHIKHTRDKYMPAAVCLGIGVSILILWNHCRKRNIDPQSLASPSTIDQKPEWTGFFKHLFGGTIKTDERAKNASTVQVKHTLEKNLFYCDFERDDGSKTRCNILFPRKCVALFPYHIFFKNGDLNGKPCEHMRLRIIRRPESSSSVFLSAVSLSQAVIFPECDMVMAYIPNCPDIKDMLKWLPLERPKGNIMAEFIVRDETCVLHTERIHVQFGDTGHKYRNFYGGRYNTSLAVSGACMGLIVSDTKNPCLVGVHIGGVPNKNFGIMQSFTLYDYEEALNKLKNIRGVCLSSLSSEIPQTQYGKDVIHSSEVHPNAKFIHELDNMAYVDVLGSTQLRSSMRSKVQKSILSDAVYKHCGVPNIWGPPQLEPNWRAFNASLDYIVHPALMHIPQHLERARQDWLEPLLNLMEQQCEQFFIRPLSFREMILGKDGVRFLDPIPMSTSMGFPLFGPKSRYFQEIRNGEVLIDRIPDDSIIEEMDRLMKRWEKGERAYPVVSATLKDEPTLQSKSKVRVFEAIAVAFGLYVRKYFLPIARFLSLNPLISESAVGVNSFSPDWDELMTFVESYNSDYLMGWDYSKYDLRMNSQMTRAVLLSYIELAARAGYDRHSLYIMEQMVNDIVHPLMDYNGTLLMVYNMNTSGNNITVNINSTANSFYVRMCFFHLYPFSENFRNACALMTYGDDGIASVNKSFPLFNIQSFIKYMKGHDMKVTLPTKDDRDDIDLLPLRELDFLKRRSFYIPEIGFRIGQLDEMSIFKSLHCNLKSSVCTDMEVAVATIESAMHEWFAYGRDHYSLRMEQMRRVCDELKVPVRNAFVPFEVRVEDWISKYQPDIQTVLPHSADYSSNALCFRERRSQHNKGYSYFQALVFMLLPKSIPEINENERRFHGTRRHGESIRKLEQFLEVDSSTYFEYALYTSIFTVGLIIAALCTSKSDLHDIPQASDVYPQSEEVQQYSEMPAPDSQKVHNVVFEDSRPGYMEIKDGSFDSLREAPLVQDASLQDFFSRPLKIASYRWGVGSNFFEDLDPWSLYFNNPRVVNRISNYKLMHARMHVKFIINGTPFHYGRLLASYTPLPLTDQLTRNVGLIEADIVQASQRPHVYINPTSSIGGEMLLPFFLPQNVLDVTYYDWRLMGEINIRSLQNLKHANGAVDTVTVSVFAWAEDVKMAIPTQFEPGTIVPQADEYGDRPISKIASATAAMMKPLMMIPTIAPFARATEIGALAVSSIAKMYGYAKTPIIDYNVMVQNSTKYQWAPTDVPDYVNKLSVDSKQEITIDPRTTGLDSTDEMSLQNIAKRESYLYAFPWQIGDLEESLLYSVVVDPCIYRAYDNGGNREIHMPACCYAAYPFKYWRGTMRYRFQVVCSNFHRGRLKFVWDPTGGSATSEYNVAYTTIVDISDKTDFTIEVGWGQPYTFKQHINFVTSSINTVMSTGVLPYSNNVIFGNGVLSVYVVNELTVPDTTINNDIEINVFVSACDDFEVAAPETTFMRRLRLQPPPASPGFAIEEIEPQSEEVVAQEDSRPTNPERLALMGKSISTFDATDKVHFGERILSFRQLAKRYDWFEMFRFASGTTNQVAQFVLRRNSFPYFPGWYSLPASSITVPVDGSNYSYANFTWLHYISCAYAGWKGSTRYFVEANQLMNPITMAAYRTSSGAPLIASQTYATGDVATMPATFATFQDNFVHVGQGGAITTNGSNLSYEVPYYNIARFTPARNIQQYVEDDPFLEKHNLVVQGGPFGNITIRPGISYVSGGEDFSTYFFIGAPIFYYEEGRPT